jgi:hypothetical protein
MADDDREANKARPLGSRFSLRDGHVERGPATAAQPAFDVREVAGRIELRRRPAP